MANKCSLLLFLAIIGISAFHCPGKMNTIMLSKIKFDYSGLNDHGLRNGEVAVDYEFCIPTAETYVEKVKSIAPEIKVMKNSKGRIGCTSEQWLLIHSTHSAEWKKQLHALAYLDFVERIEETFYE